MRVFAFANGYGQDGYESSKMSRPFQPRLGTFSDDGLSRLDLVVAAAAKNGLRLILPLSNWWDEQGGCQWWVCTVCSSIRNCGGENRAGALRSSAGLLESAAG